MNEHDLPDGWIWMTEQPAWWSHNRWDQWICGAWSRDEYTDDEPSGTITHVCYSDACGGVLSVAELDDEHATRTTDYSAAQDSVVLAVIARGRALLASA